MLSPKTQTNLTNAKTYFDEHLAMGDYDTEANRVSGEWIGGGATALGLDGAVDQKAFVALCDNLHPQTGERLTLRKKTTRQERTHDGEESLRQGCRRGRAGCPRSPQRSGNHTSAPCFSRSSSSGGV